MGEIMMERIFKQPLPSMNQEALLDLVYASPLAKKLILELHLSKEEVLNNVDKILFFVQQNACCEQCQSLKDCKKTKKGTQLYLNKEENSNVLVETIRICDYYQEFYQKEQRLLYSFYSMETIFSQHRLQEFRSICLQLPKSFQTMYLKLYHHSSTKGCYLQIKDSRQRKIFEIGLLSTLLHQYRCSLVKISQFLSDLKALFADKNRYEDLLMKVYQCDVLILDDIGGESITSWSRDDILLPLLNARIDQHLTTIFISEFSLEQLPLLYTIQKDHLKAEKLISKMKELMD